MSRKPTISLAEFQRIDLRAGTVVKAEPFPKARKPAYKLWVDLGELGVRKSSAQITRHYQPEALIGTQVLCIVNFEPRQIADFMSEVLVTGFSDSEGNICLARPDQPVPNGNPLH